jgi:hypothetical protein
MKILIPVVVALCAAASMALGQAEAPLSDQMIGEWVLQGRIGKKENTTHDVKAEWVLNREYVRIHEVSREKNEKGAPAYEAIIFVQWDSKKSEYSLLWLDSTEGGGVSADGIAHGKPEGDRIPFLFKDSGSGGIRNTFIYDKSTDTWQWIIDNLSGDKATRFADVRLTKKK